MDEARTDFGSGSVRGAHGGEPSSNAALGTSTYNAPTPGPAGHPGAGSANAPSARSKAEREGGTASSWRRFVGRRRRRDERAIVDRLRELNATSHDSACRESVFEDLGGARAADALRRSAFVRRTGPGRYYVDEQALAAARAKRRSARVAAVVAGAHLAIAVGGVVLAKQACDPVRSRCVGEFFDPVAMSAEAFFGALITTGAVLYALLAAAQTFGLDGGNAGRRVAGVSALSLAVSVLLAVDAKASAGEGAPGADGMKSFWDVVFALLMERRAVSLLALVTLAALAVCVYHGARALLTVEYEGSGIQIRLPGQTVYYVPLYPQISWQNTRIALKAGERVSIEISGYVSPGALGNLSDLRKQMDAYVRWEQQRVSAPAGNGDASGDGTSSGHAGGDGGTEVGSSGRARRRPSAKKAGRAPTVDTWAYTGPAGYPESWYKPGQQPPFLEKHALYREAYYYQKDRDLTVTGVPHNVVLGMIISPGDAAPCEARPDANQHGYDYSNAEHRSKLLYLSSRRYPIAFEVERSGELWAVINDVDIARWDNTGMFFLKLTRHAWL